MPAGCDVIAYPGLYAGMTVSMAVSGRRSRKFTWQELAELNERRNVHVAVRGKVYDLTPFVNEHPGGVDQILLAAGRDITQMFETYHDFSVYKVLKKFYVGDLVSNELPVYQHHGEFARTLKKRVKNRFKELELNPKDARWTLMRYVWIVLGTAFFWYLQTFVYSGCLAGSFVATIGLAISTSWSGLHMGHDSSHFSITNKPWVWKVVSFWTDILLGSSSLVWMHQHTVGHHSYTNVDHADPDIVTAADHLPDIRRIKKSQRWLPQYFHQHIYAPILYGVLIWKIRIEDFFIILVSRKNGNIRINKLTPLQWTMFFGCKTIFFFYRLVIPLMVGISVLQLLSLTILCDAIVSYYLALLVQASHVFVNSSWPLPDENGYIYADWWEMQVRTTQDYSTDSWFTTLVTGALNHQTAHHLFPGIAQCFYPIVTPIVKQTCEEFGVEYHCVDSVWEAIKSHLFHLKKLGRYEKSTNSQTDSKKLR